MAPTIQPGDILYRHRFHDTERELERGAVVVFEAFEGMEDTIPEAVPGSLYLFRAIGLPGDRIALKRDTLYLNGRALAEPYASYVPWDDDAPREAYWKSSDFGPIEVPEGAAVVLGDNRYNALDSRYFGPVPLRNIVGYVEADG